MEARFADYRSFKKVIQAIPKTIENGILRFDKDGLTTNALGSDSITIFGASLSVRYFSDYKYTTPRSFLESQQRKKELADQESTAAPGEAGDVGETKEVKRAEQEEEDEEEDCYDLIVDFSVLKKIFKVSNTDNIKGFNSSAGGADDTDDVTENLVAPAKAKREGDESDDDDDDGGMDQATASALAGRAIKKSRSVSTSSTASKSKSLKNSKASKRTTELIISYVEGHDYITFLFRSLNQLQKIEMDLIAMDIGVPVSTNPEPHCVVKLFSENLWNICRNSGGDVLTFKLAENSLSIQFEETLYKSTTQYKTNDNIAIKYNPMKLAELKDIECFCVNLSRERLMSMMIGKNLSPYVKMYFYMDKQPVHIEYNIDDSKKNGFVKYSLAPRVSKIAGG